jgi:AcrR family transcriptional regulator
MRAIAREVGVAPASLYTYFEGLDDVFTMLLLSSYRRLAAATAAAAEHFADEPPEDRSFAAILAHRRWALDHRNEFNLLFTDQLPGYAAPEGGPTIEAQAEVFRPMLAALAQLDPGHPGDPGDPGDELAIIQDVGVAIWAAFHGAVSLEVNHQLDWIADPAAVHERVVRGAFESAGIPAPSATMRRRFERWASSALS